ncbi:MAG: cation:proton antiporter domain-containing protein [Candidatus Helarchaeota archaeon]
MDNLLILMIIILSVTIFPFLGERARIPAIVIELLLGIILGENGLIPLVQYQAGDWLDFLSSLGFIFLMFLAGLEINMDKLKRFFKKSVYLTLVLFFSGFIIGYFSGLLLFLSPIGCMLLGTVFSCASIGIVFPTLKDLGLSKKELGLVVISATILLDIIGLSLMSVLIGINNAQGYFIIIDLFIQVGLIATLLIVSLFLSKRVWNWADKNFPPTSVLEWEMRISLSLILILSVVFTLLKIEVIIGAFIAGLIMGESKYAEKELEGKIGAIGYGFLIPIFFFMIGTRTNLQIFFNLQNYYLIIVSIIVIILAIASRLLGGFLGSKAARFSNKKSIVVASSMIPRLSIGLAVANIGLEVGIFDENVFTIIVLVAFITSLMTPILTNSIARKLLPEELIVDQDEIRNEHLKHLGIYIDEEYKEPLKIFTDTKVRDLMTDDVITVNSEINVRDFIDLVEQTKHNTYPVLDNQKDLIGIVAMKDVEKFIKNDEFDVKLRECCRKDLCILKPNDELGKAFDFMIEKDVHSICVTESKNDKQLVGIVSKTDIMRALQIKLLKKDKFENNIE